MLVRFDCPACQNSHSFDMPETTIHMTCARSGAVLQLKLTGGGDVRASVVENHLDGKPKDGQPGRR